MAGSIFDLIYTMGLSKHSDKYVSIAAELEKIDLEPVLLNGHPTKPSSCYRLSGNPPQVIFNTNCPDDVKGKIEAILLKYRTAD